jgi:hypothetical protein
VGLPTFTHPKEKADFTGVNMETFSTEHKSSAKWLPPKLGHPIITLTINPLK